MTSAGLQCRLYIDPRRHGAVPGAGCAAVDVALDPEAAAALRRLGLQLPDDLPVALLASGDGRIKVLGVRLAAAEVERLAAGRAWPPAATIVYAAGWCPDCRRTKRLLDEAGLPFAEVDIEQDPQAEALVLQRSGGRRVVPTLQLDGRLWAFNPEPALLRQLIAP
jgi:mycoredoxin